MTTNPVRPADLVAEFEDVHLGDRRLDARMLAVVQDIAASPGASFPMMVERSADREALYRFLGNERVNLGRLLSCHVSRTLKRVAEERTVRVVHDTTGLVFSGEREGLGPIKGARGQGFFTHVALAVSADERRNALGILGATTYAHEKNSPRKTLTRSQQTMLSRQRPRDQKISSRWERQALSVHHAIRGGVHAVHVMDQEADDFAMFTELLAAGIPFVVRCAGTRLTARGAQSISNLLRAESSVLFRTVNIQKRPPHKARGQSRPARGEREAALSIRWSSVALPKPDNVRGRRREPLRLNVVQVYEPQPPPGEEAVEWFLLTNEQVATLDDATRVVDHYRARWTIEEFFKALKTGCAIEKRQLTTYAGLTRALGLLLPVAWKLLLLRQLARDPARTPATAVFTPSHLELIRLLLRKRRKDHSLPADPTARDAMLAIAALGGHILNNGEPGWLVLGRGLQVYLDAELLWEALRSDQS